MSPVKILIVEDELLIAKGLARKLEKLGYEVVGIVSSGKAALNKIREIIPDLILMDIVIKGDIDGIETTEKIRKQYNIPVIYLTAYADDETLSRAEKTGSYGYLLKPFKEREVHATIKMALKKYQESLSIKSSLAQAKSNSQEKTEYISIASHDLKTPLTAIQMSAGMLQRYGNKLTEEKKEKHLKRIQTAAQHMHQLLEDILTLSRTEFGKLEFNPEQMNVVEFCEEIIEEIKVIASSKHNLELTLYGENRIINLDAMILRHVLSNLLSNAIKYSPNGGIVKLDITQTEAEIRLAVRDQGIGLPLDYHQKLFQRFERGANVGKIPGTGLGLSIVKRLIDLHGGEIMVESEQGKGSAFTVTFPCVF
ncbi:MULTISPECIES: ATP-binding protein [unclassified Roseofilum]|uniref:hybrid sensor histidine kinase/response regulator n=1 Tax=unclassified Roseofilum TaxID=2620099 RepID=UPI000E8DCDD5|nr:MULTISPECIES: ATP-binding protein [unclassified Roseofilum]MBP0007702.1 response regulator [Roseofilum sp. Belize Diploria]MBP0031606.1 response regulator [Roseofilum sp. Belize BBD 4]HBR00425.1 hybrid sensor histidine kinase/response regulator [Cyanobacteria bacterium UBA11691]